MFTCGAKMIASLAQHRLILFPYIHVMCSGVLHVFISVYYLDCTEFTITKIMFRKMKRWKKKMWRLTRKMQKQTVLVVMFAFRSTVKMWINMINVEFSSFAINKMLAFLCRAFVEFESQEQK